MKRKTSEEFINIAKSVHKNKYDYSLVEYKNNKTKVMIVCPKHGMFLQEAKSHLNGSGCIKCHHNETAKRLQYSNADFIKLATEKHNNIYNYTNTTYINSHTKVEIDCKQHGEFEMAPAQHLYGQGCPKCGYLINGRKYTTEEFINIANLIHGNKFDYSLVNYENSTTPITIKCPKHGIFKQKPTYHLTNTISCPTCVNILRSKNGVGGYSFSFFEDNPDMKKNNALLYIIKLHDDKEVFIKIGITVRELHTRFSKFKINGYTVTPIYISNMHLYDAFIKEQTIINTFIENSYKPNRRFNGWSECFTHELIDTILNLVDQ